MSWPNCNKGALCCFKHPEPLIPKLPSFHPEPLPNIPAGTYQALGTTYFPVAQDPNAPTSPSAPVPYSPSARSGFSPYSNASLPFFSPIYEPKRPPFVAPPLVAIASNSSEDANRYIGMPPPIPINDVKIAGDVKVDDASSIGEASTEEFPYRPSTHQRPGHTRRISVTLKSKEDSDALGLSQTRTSRRPSWMTHSKRDAETHRVSRYEFISDTSWFILTCFMRCRAGHGHPNLWGWLLPRPITRPISAYEEDITWNPSHFSLFFV